MALTQEQKILIGTLKTREIIDKKTYILFKDFKVVAGISGSFSSYHIKQVFKKNKISSIKKSNRATLYCIDDWEQEYINSIGRKATTNNREQESLTAYKDKFGRVWMKPREISKLFGREQSWASVTAGRNGFPSNSEGMYLLIAFQNFVENIERKANYRSRSSAT